MLASCHSRGNLSSCSRGIYLLLQIGFPVAIIAGYFILQTGHSDPVVSEFLKLEKQSTCTGSSLDWGSLPIRVFQIYTRELVWRVKCVFIRTGVGSDSPTSSVYTGNNNKIPTRRHSVTDIVRHPKST
jgi:hypothetical protein